MVCMCHPLRMRSLSDLPCLKRQVAGTPTYEVLVSVSVRVRIVRSLTQKDKKKSTAPPTPSDKICDTPTCSGCDAAIGKHVKALQCDYCSSPHAWKCIECLDIRPSVYDALTDGQGTEMRWFCIAFNDLAMKQSEKLDEMMNPLKLLTAKSIVLRQRSWTKLTRAL